MIVSIVENKTSKEDLEEILSDVTWERQNCPVTKGSNLLVDLYVEEKKHGKGSMVEIPADAINDVSIRQLVKDKRIRIVTKKNKKFASFIKLGKIVAMGEISLRLRERKNAARSGAA